MRLAFLLVALPLAACGGAYPQAAFDRCQAGAGDDNNDYTVRQGPACRIVASGLLADGQPRSAASYARKACELQDAAGCEIYLKIARKVPAEVTRARDAGEKACDGMVVSNGGADPRPRICYATGELYADVSPRSPDDGARLFARACRLGDPRGCPRAGDASADLHPPDAPPRRAPPPPPPPPTSTVVTQVVAPQCHESRSCVSFDVKRHNVTEVQGTLTNRCDHAVTCRWCPSHGTDVDKSKCRDGHLNPGETRAGQADGVWYDGYDALGYDCVDEHDVIGCLSL